MQYQTTLSVPGGLYLSFGRDTSAKLRIHGLTREKFDALTGVFEVIEEKRPTNVDDKTYFLTAIINFGGAPLTLFTQHFDHELEPDQLSLLEN